MKNAYALAALPFLAACSNAPSVPDITSYFSPYRIDVRQGNMVTQDMVAQLKPGQTRDQVRFILGTPLVSDIFHADRWDYVYRFQPGNKGEVQQRRFVVFFQDGKLVRVGGDVVADESVVDAPPAKPAAQIIEIAPAAAPAKPK